MTAVLLINTIGAILADDLLTNRVSQGLADVTLVSDDSEIAAVWIAGRHKSKITGRGKGESEFLRQVKRMEDAFRDISGLLLAAGDFNTRAIEWGMPETNNRGSD